MKCPYDTNQVLDAIDYFKNQNRGLCFAFSENKDKPWLNGSSYVDIPKFLRKLGGRSRDGWFWGYPIDNPLSQQQRATMLAFMLAWSQDKDFEV